MRRLKCTRPTVGQHDSSPARASLVVGLRNSHGAVRRRRGRAGLIDRRRYGDPWLLATEAAAACQAVRVAEPSAKRFKLSMYTYGRFPTADLRSLCEAYSCRGDLPLCRWGAIQRSIPVKLEPADNNPALALNPGVCDQRAPACQRLSINRFRSPACSNLGITSAENLRRPSS